LAGDRVWDLAVRAKYADLIVDSKNIFDNLSEAISNAVKQTNENEALFILPTYSAMLESRKILTGKKIL